MYLKWMIRNCECEVKYQFSEHFRLTRIQIFNEIFLLKSQIFYSIFGILADLSTIRPFVCLRNISEDA